MGGGADLRLGGGGGIEHGIAMIFPPSHLLCTMKSQTGGQWEGGSRCEWGIERGRKEMFYLTTHSTHFIYGYMASDIW